MGVAAGDHHSLGLKADGSIVAWGYNAYDQTNVPAPNADFIGIAAGYNYSLGLKADGAIVGWGANYYGQTDVPAPNSGFVVIAAGVGQIVAIRSPDQDSDSVHDAFDNCPSLANPNQADCDSDGIGDACAIAEGGSPDANANGIPDECEDGACCNLLTGACTEAVLDVACSGNHRSWMEGAVCVDVECDADTGACCAHDPFGGCTDGLTQADCDCPTCEWVKLGSCSDLDCIHTAIPTVSSWGLAILSLLLLTGAKIAFGRRTQAQ